MGRYLLASNHGRPYRGRKFRLIKLFHQPHIRLITSSLPSHPLLLLIASRSPLSDSQLHSTAKTVRRRQRTHFEHDDLTDDHTGSSSAVLWYVVLCFFTIFHGWMMVPLYSVFFSHPRTESSVLVSFYFYPFTCAVVILCRSQLLR